MKAIGVVGLGTLGRDEGLFIPEQVLHCRRAGTEDALEGNARTPHSLQDRCRRVASLAHVMYHHLM
jgi:hypothetical protein